MPDEKLHLIADELRKIAKLAEDSGADMLTYIIEVALDEARREITLRSPSGPDEPRSARLS